METRINKDLPVVAVVATHGVERLPLLMDRALPSISRQTCPVDLVIIVSDNDPADDPLLRDDSPSVSDKLPSAFRDKVRLLSNARTRRTSGTGSWNTGIMEAYSTFEDCWVAILDDDDEWKDGHVNECLASAAANKECQWVVSGIIRQGGSGITKEHILTTKPSAGEFFTTNPGVQGSNIFVRVGLLLKAGLFDERLPSTTDRDLCIRMCDVLEGEDNSFASTGMHTVIHYADTDRQRVSSKGSKAKIQGLTRFYLKHAPRMTNKECDIFKQRAEKLFGCKKSEFDSVDEIGKPGNELQAWSGDLLPICTGTADLLPVLEQPASLSSTPLKQNALFGIITSDIERVRPLMRDLASVSASPAADFTPFVVFFANSAEIGNSLRAELKQRGIRGYVLTRSNSVVDTILKQCNGVDVSSCQGRLPIALSRTVLQVFIFSIVGYLEGVDAVVILDDDKRLPKGWSPFVVSDNADKSKGNSPIFIGRDLRTPPNPSIFSLRINLIDLLYSLDLQHTKGKAKSDIEHFCFTQDIFENKYDWYYDLSTARFDHLEMPVYKRDTATSTSFQEMLSSFLVGTPLCRDVIPLDSGTTSQRGGCMVILNSNDKPFQPLAVQQHAPVITHSNGGTSHSRRSDSFWCQSQQRCGRKVLVHEKLYVYHDNRFDIIHSPTSTRMTIVEEVLGGILCRETRHRDHYKETRVLHLRSWLLRLKGILTTFRHRPYATDEFIASFIAPLEAIFDSQMWEAEVFSVIEREYKIVKDFAPHPMDFSSVSLDQSLRGNAIIQVGEEDKKELVHEWNKIRISAACETLTAATGHNAEFVGIGNEGVSFVHECELYKVFDQDPKLDQAALALLGAAFIEHVGSTSIIKRPYLSGTLYRGGYGPALVHMLRDLRSKNVYHSNITPDNLLFNKKTKTVAVIDLGRDVHHEESQSLYEEHFKDMCKRSFICFRFGNCGGNGYMLKDLKKAAKNPSERHTAGFDNFMAMITNDQDTMPEVQLLSKLEKLNAECCGIVAHSDLPNLPFPTILSGNEDRDVISSIEKIISAKFDRDNSGPIVLVIEDPYDASSHRRPLYFYKRHLRRFLQNRPFSIEEDCVSIINQEDFVEYSKYHIFVLVPRDPGCFLLIKSCPMEHKIITSNVRRIVHCLEAAISFKAIVLVADISKTCNCIRQYESSNLELYHEALGQIKQERLVDHLIVFDGENAQLVQELNGKWFGSTSCLATHSSEGQHYASTLHAFQAIQDLKCYDPDDLVLQCDSDIIFHCENSTNGLGEIAREFRKEPDLVTFAFPIPGAKDTHSRQYFRQEGTPPRMEIRCSFLHLRRVSALLPLAVPPSDTSDVKDFCLRRGWWHVLDFNIHSRGMKSVRGSLAGIRWFFIHPQNVMKGPNTINDLHIVSDAISSNLCLMSDLEDKEAWKGQIGKVDLQSTESDWLRQRNESTVVVFHLVNTSESEAVHSFESFIRHSKDKPEFEGCGLIVLDNGSFNYEDIATRIFQRAQDIFGVKSLTTFRSRNGLSADKKLKTCIQRFCANPKPNVFTINPGKVFDLQPCMLPLTYCYECESYFEGQACPCLNQIACFDFTDVPVTRLPIGIPSFENNPSRNHNTTFYAPEMIVEGSLTLGLAACVKGNDSIKDAEYVCVRVHSECLTGDVFYSLKCDCGEQKLKFMHIMEDEPHAVLLYIKGHEGRGNGLSNKIEAYRRTERKESENHVNALLDLGLPSDIRQYNAAFMFLKNKLQMKSIKLYSNNPNKIEAARKIFGAPNVTQCSMPTVAGKYNGTYLKEKVELCGHEGLLEG